MARVGQKPLHDVTTQSHLETLFIRSGLQQIPSYLRSLISPSKSREIQLAVSAARPLNSTQRCDEALDKHGQKMQELSLQEVRKQRSIMRGAEAKKKMLREGRVAIQKQSAKARVALLAELLDDLKPRQILMDQEAVTDMWCKLVNGRVKFGCEDDLKLCEEAAARYMEADDLSCKYDHPSYKQRVALKVVKRDRQSQPHHYEGAFQYFNYRLLHTQSSQTMETNRFCRIRFPRKTHVRKRRREWLKLTAEEKLRLHNEHSRCMSMQHQS